MNSVYPKRPPFFAHRFCRLLIKTCVAQEIGPEATLLLMTVAHTEDAARYRRPVTFFNAQIYPICGLYSEPAFIRARDKAIQAGWLHYEKGSNRAAGRYWVLVPEHATELDDNPTDEGFDSDMLTEQTSTSPSGTEAEPKRSRSGAETEPPRLTERTENTSTSPSGTEAELKRNRNGIEAEPIYPIPNPIPKTKGASPPSPPATISQDAQESSDTSKEINADGARAPAKKRETAESVPIPESLQTSEFITAWATWLRERRERRKPVSATAAKRQLAECARYGPVAGVAAIERSLKSDWRGLFPENETHGTNTHGRRAPDFSTHGIYPGDESTF